MNKLQTTALGFIAGLITAIAVFTTLPTDTGGRTPRVNLTATGPRTFDDLLDAIEWVESKGDPWAVGDDGAAVGAYQIHKIYVDDCNRIARVRGDVILKSSCMFTYRDRENKQMSRKMVKMFLRYYGGTFEEMARKHNGGPNGHNKESTEAYWVKVKARMDEKSGK